MMNQHFSRRTLLTGLAASLATPALALNEWPDRSITLVHGLAPGGPSDVIARLVADSLSRRLGQQVIVDARPGAGGRVAAAQVARAAPDGYTLMTVPSGHAVSAALYRSLAYRAIDDFTMISMLTEFPFILVTAADNPARSLREWLAQARQRATPMLFGSAGNGSLQHLAGELLSRTINVTFQHVPYRGSAQAITDMMARRIDFMVDSPTVQMEAIRGGKVRALAVTSPQRFFSLPNVPTAAEEGLSDYTFTSWQGMIGPAGMPSVLADRISVEIAGALAEPEIVERIQAMGNTPVPTTPSQFKSRMTAEIDKWSQVIAAAQIERM